MAEFIAENPFEELLVRAATDPAARPAFYRELRSSKLCVLPAVKPSAEDKALTLARWEGPSGAFIPLFSSRRRVDEASGKTAYPTGVLAIEGAMLFQLLSQHPLEAVLNPGLAYGKQFTQDEIRRVADGTILDAGQKLVVEKATQIFLGQPAVFPRRLVDAISNLLRQRPSVEAAYVAQVLIQGEPSPHPVIGLVSTNYAKDVEEAGLAARDIAEPSPVDFVDMRGQPDHVIAQYLRGNAKPFYQRAKQRPWWKPW